MQLNGKFICEQISGLNYYALLLFNRGNGAEGKKAGAFQLWGTQFPKIEVVCALSDIPVGIPRVLTNLQIEGVFESCWSNSRIQAPGPLTMEIFILQLPRKCAGRVREKSKTWRTISTSSCRFFFKRLRTFPPSKGKPCTSLVEYETWVIMW